MKCFCQGSLTRTSDQVHAGGNPQGHWAPGGWKPYLATPTACLGAEVYQSSSTRCCKDIFQLCNCPLTHSISKQPVMGPDLSPSRPSAPYWERADDGDARQGIRRLERTPGSPPSTQVPTSTPTSWPPSSRGPNSTGPLSDLSFCSDAPPGGDASEQQGGRGAGSRGSQVLSDLGGL